MRLFKFAACFMAVAAIGMISQAQTTEDFEGGTVMPATTFFTHDGSGFLGPADSLTDEGLPDVSAFAGAGGGSMGSATATLGLDATGGVGGTQGVLLNLTNDGTTGFSFGGVQQSIGVVANPSLYTATADVLAPSGVPLSLRVESPFSGSNNGFELNFVGTGAFQTVGGVVGTDLTAIGGGTFDPAAPAQILVATQIGSSIPVGSTDIVVDNFSFTLTSVPEPGSLALLAGLIPAIAMRRRRS